MFHCLCKAILDARYGKKLKDQDIIELFNSVAENAGEKSREAQDVFISLVKSTLRYRDHLEEAKGIIITVEDVKCTLNWLIPTLNTGKLPETENKIRLDLLKLWVEELKLR